MREEMDHPPNDRTVRIKDPIVIGSSQSPTLDLLVGISRRFPRIRGAGALGTQLWKFMRHRIDGTVQARVHGFDMLLDPRQACSGALLFYPQLYDRIELAFIRDELGPGDCFLDLGANVGIYSMTGHEAVRPCGTVLAVEADPYNYSLLTSNVASNQGHTIEPVNLALSDEQASEPFWLHPNRSGSSLVKPSNRSIQVETMPLLDVLAAKGIDQVDGAKIDLEGMEYRVLSPFLREASDSLVPRFLIVEDVPDRTDVSGGNVVHLLTEHGFEEVRRSRINRLFLRGGA